MTILFFEKKNGRVEDDFTCNVILHPGDLSLFYKKKISTNPFLQIRVKINTQIQKYRYSVVLYQLTINTYESEKNIIS